MPDRVDHLAGYKAAYAEKKRKRKEKKQKAKARAIKLASNDPSVKQQVAISLLAEGFLNEALARNAKTTRAGDFYKSKQWASVRYAALIKSDGRCQCCGASKADGAKLHVDHIKPRSKFPGLALDLNNLQVLCDLCNIAKSNIDMTNWKDKVSTDDQRGSQYREYMEDERRIFRMIKSFA